MPESFYRRFRVSMRVRHEVTAIHPESKTVSVKSLETGDTFEEGYDKLILSHGAKPARPPIPGVDLDGILTLRTVEDTFRLKEHINAHHPRSAVLVGGGFIGVELAENLRDMGIDVTIVEQLPQLVSPFDPDMAAFIHSEMRSHGVTPGTAIAKEAGLDLGIRGSIVVNDRMEASVPDIYAVGDAVQVKHAVTGQDGPANKQGRITADNICGSDSRYSGAQGSAILKIFELTAL